MLAFGSVAEALDSLLEGDGFEPSVPVAREPVYIAEGELRGDRQKNWRGTDGFARNKFGTSVPLIVGSDNVKIRTNEVTRNNALGVGILQNPLASEDPRIVLRRQRQRQLPIVLPISGDECFDSRASQKR